MKNIKNFLIIFIGLSSISNCFGGPRLVKSWTGICNFFSKAKPAPAGTVAVGKLGEVLEAQGPNLGAFAGNETLKTFFEGAKPFVKAAVPFVYVVSGAYAVSKLVPVAKEFKSAFWPSDEEKQRGAICRKEHTKLQAEEDLRKALIENARGERGALNIPIVCEKNAQALVMAGGKAELERVLEDFKLSYGERPC